MDEALLNVVLIAKENTSLSFLRALQSVMDQAYPAIRVLVIDANEPNSAYSLGLQEDLSSFPMVEYQKVDPSLSITQIRNHCIHTLEGEFISFLSSNDRWDSLFALLQMDQLRKDQAAAASCCNGLLIDERKKQILARPFLEQVTYDAASWIIDSPAKRSAQVIYRTSALRAEGGFDNRFETYCDADMLLRLYKTHNVLLIPVSLCECHITSADLEYDAKLFRDGQRVLEKYRAHFILDRKLTISYYRRMLQLAKNNYLWLNLCGYLIMIFLTSPWGSLVLAAKKLIKTSCYILKWIYRELSSRRSYLRILLDIRRMQKGKALKIKLPKPEPLNEKEASPFIFTSANQYNEQSSLSFAFQKKLKSIVIPEYVTVIKAWMFYDCKELVSVEIPSTVTEIQAHAFHNCKSLRHITFQEGSRLSRIGPYAFAGCSSLETICLPSTLNQLGKFAFFECVSLKQLLFSHIYRGKEQVSEKLPSTISSIPSYTFAGCSNLLTLETDINSMLEAVENGAFLGCNKLVNLLLTGRLQQLGNYAFAYCKELETVAIPQIDSLKSIGKCAFKYCEALIYFQVPNQINRINIRTFYGCKRMKSIKIPKKVLSISHQAFAKCSSLKKATLLTGDIAISPTAFDKNTEIEILDNIN
jgi:hypothetical protein